MMPFMQGHSSRRHRWRRFVRHNRNLFFAGVLLVIVLAAVVAIFWVLTSGRFIADR
jgi:phosphotransferase system  glucose/maltose/N-acetylglucosamine-specific IIC component